MVINLIDIDRWLAERELAVQALLARSQCRASTRLVTRHPGRPIFRGISQYLTTMTQKSLVYCALLASDMAQLREVAQEYGLTSLVLLSEEIHYRKVIHRQRSV